jgi:hypothetical protein
MRPPIDLRTTKLDPLIADSIMRIFDDLYGIVSERQNVVNGQTTPVGFEKFRVRGNSRGHVFEVTIDDSNPTTPTVSLKDVGTKLL